jgi:hypothetical protein
MRHSESELRAIRDRVASALGAIEESAVDVQKKSNYFRIADAARELHRCADEMQNMLGKLRPR